MNKKQLGKAHNVKSATMAMYCRGFFFQFFSSLEKKTVFPFKKEWPCLEPFMSDWAILPVTTTSHPFLLNVSNTQRISRARLSITCSMVTRLNSCSTLSYQLSKKCQIYWQRVKRCLPLVLLQEFLGNLKYQKTFRCSIIFVLLNRF